MQGLKVKCPNCGRTDFITTDKYDPAIRPNGGMVKCTLSYFIDWLTSSTTLCAEMTCPECLAQLAPSGVLNVMVPARECGQFFEEYVDLIIDVVLDVITPQPTPPSEIVARGPMEILESLGEKIRQNDPPPVISKSVEKRLEVQMGKKRGKR